MGESGTIFRKGTGGVQFHPVPFLLLKTPPRNNVLIGDDAIQIRFMEQLTGLQCETRERVCDDDLFGKDGILIRLLTGNTLELSAQLRAKTGVWACGRPCTRSPATLRRPAGESRGRPRSLTSGCLPALIWTSDLAPLR